MSRIFKSAIAAFAIAVTAAAGAPAALAESGVEQMSVRVRYADLDMSSVAGGHALLGRIQRAARMVCEDTIPHSPLTPRAVRACRTETVANVVHDLNIAGLTLAWSGRNMSTLASR